MPNPITQLEFNAVILQNEEMDAAYMEVPHQGDVRQRAAVGARNLRRSAMRRTNREDGYAVLHHRSAERHPQTDWQELRRYCARHLLRTGKIKIAYRK